MNIDKIKTYTLSIFCITLMTLDAQTGVHSSLAQSDQNAFKDAYIPQTSKNDEAITVLKGIIIKDPNAKLTEDDINRELIGVEFVNIQIPGNVKNLNKILLSKFIGKTLTINKIIELKNAICSYFAQSSYPFVQIEIPPQKISNGILHINIIKGVLGTLSVEPPTTSNEKKVARALSIKEKNPINIDLIARDIAWLNKNPFNQFDVIFEQGQAPSTTDICVKSQYIKPYRFYAGADNTGFDETEPNRLFIGSNLGNIFGTSHYMTLQLTSAPEIHKFWALTGNYIAPLAWKDTLEFYGGFSQVKGDLNDGFGGLRNSGYSAQASGRYNWTLIPNQSFLSEVSLGFDFKRTNNNLIYGGEKVYQSSVNLTQLVLGYNGQYTSDMLSLCFAIEGLYSPGAIFGEQTNQDYSNVQFDAKSSYFYSRGSISPKINLPKDFTLLMILRAQLASQNLLPSEQFGLGGANSVRGYKEREINVDNALLFTAELHAPSHNLFLRKKTRDLIQFLAFVDYAYGRNVHKGGIETLSSYLLGVGPGIRYQIGQNFTAKTDLGIQLKKLNSKGYRINFSLVGSF